MLKPFSEEISTGQVQAQENENFEGKTEEITEPTEFEIQTKEFIDDWAQHHPGGIGTFVRGLDKGLKYGLRPQEMEILFRTWFHNKGIISDSRQKEVLEFVWPTLENTIDKVGPPWKGRTIYHRNTPPHPEGVPKSAYGEYYHRDVGWY
jgi:hypothetical protein